MSPRNKHRKTDETKINDSKVLYRIQHFKDFQNALLSINGGTIIATMAYLSSLNEKKHLFLVLGGVAALGITIAIQIFIIFSNFVMLGLIHDGDDELASKIGKYFLTPLILLSLFLTPVGFCLVFLFVCINA